MPTKSSNLLALYQTIKGVTVLTNAEHPDLSKLTCPDCKQHTLEYQHFDSDFIEGGYDNVVCTKCKIGFASPGCILLAPSKAKKSKSDNEEKEDSVSTIP